MTRADVQRWLDRYVAAWKSYDAGEIADLFSSDAEYRYHPWDDPVSGREAIVADWIAPDGNASSRDAEGTYDAAYEAWAVDGDRAVAVGTSDYFTDASRTKRDRRYHNVYLLEFDADGRCRSFTECFIEQR
ncbi:MAG TPA: nuclear transport factor 2 family protein [Candidatus Limnocylindrales bacterium]|nr:nuclear transport factor 2 family protein [Candidatus Limnocylindrales bacterium]